MKPRHRRPPVIARCAAPLAALLVALLLLGGCGDDAPPAAAPLPADLAGDWDVALVVGAVDADPGADPATFPGDATFLERWRFEDCDEQGCTLRRPDGGFLLGDLDGVRVALGAADGLDVGDRVRLIGRGDAAEPPPADPADASPCDGSTARRWSVRIEVGVGDGVLSGSVIRTPEALRTDVEGTACFGLDLTLGLSGTMPG